jgi:hypothetical protein
VEGNPILDYCKNIVFGYKNEFLIQRKTENGGDMYVYVKLDFTRHMQIYKTNSRKGNCIQVT